MSSSGPECRRSVLSSDCEAKFHAEADEEADEEAEKKRRRKGLNEFPGDRLYTSNPGDLRKLCGAAGNNASVIGC